MKHVCPSCSSRYYDLKQPAQLCPSCGSEPAAARLPSGGRSARGLGGRSPFGRRRAAPEERAPLPEAAEREEAEDEDEEREEADEAGEEKELA